MRRQRAKLQEPESEAQTRMEEEPLNEVCSLPRWPPVSGVVIFFRLPLGPTSIFSRQVYECIGHGFGT